MSNYVEQAKSLIERIPYITIASVTKDGLPWNTPVFAVHDKEYNFFWNSSKESEHSKNITSSGKVFLVIYDSNAKAGEGFGVYIQAEAKELVEGEELGHALKVFYAKKDKEPKSQKEILESKTQRFYKATPVKCWVNEYDKTRIPADWREEINLN